MKNIPNYLAVSPEECTFLGKLLYGQLCDEVIPVSSVEIAETFENAFRNVNIVLVDEGDNQFDAKLRCFQNRGGSE
jgi:UDP-N-acetyl-D-mannosaminuronate dehydrogenase